MTTIMACQLTVGTVLGDGRRVTHLVKHGLWDKPVVTAVLEQVGPDGTCLTVEATMELAAQVQVRTVQAVTA